MSTQKIKLFQLLLFLLLVTGVNQVFAQYNVEINNKSSRTVAIRIDGNFQSNLEPGKYVSYLANYKSIINFSLADTDPEVVQAIQNSAYQGINWKYDWTQYQMYNLSVESSGIVNLVPALHSDGTYTWVTVQIEPRYQQQTTYADTDNYYDDDDDDLVWYMILGLLVGAILPFLF